MAQKKKTVLLFSTFNTPFITSDRRILETIAESRTLISRSIFAAAKLVWFSLTHDVLIAWFASTYSALLVFMSNLLQKKSIIIVGGADVNVDRELEYGLLRSPWKRGLVRYALRRATHVLPMSQQLAERAKQVVHYDGENIRDVAPGLDPQFWKPGTKKETMILTVAACQNENRVRIKGIDTLMDAARSLEGIPFLIIGIEPAVLESMGIHHPPNVSIQPPVVEKELLPYYQRAKVYCQPSRIESFSVTLAQAMLCECVPVGTHVGGMPSVIGDSGFLVPPDDPELLAATLEKALGSSPSAARTARKGIEARFPAVRRLRKLRQLIAE